MTSDYDNSVITVSSTTVTPTDPVTIGFWFANQIQAGVWAVFVCAILVVFFTRKKVSNALEAHFALMKSMETAIQTNAANQTRNADSQEQLAKVLAEMEVTDGVTRKDIEVIKRTQYEILEYVSGIPSRRFKPNMRPLLDRHDMDDVIDGSS